MHAVAEKVCDPCIVASRHFRVPCFFIALKLGHAACVECLPCNIQFHSQSVEDWLYDHPDDPKEAFVQKLNELKVPYHFQKQDSRTL